MNPSFYSKYKILFWQPQTDWFKVISKKKLGNTFLVCLNYFLWVFLFYVSYLLIKQNTNIFWQLLLATIVSEIVEKFLKSKLLWPRPLHLRQNIIPDGMFKSWYQKGSFPSGHAIKIAFFLMFVIQNQIPLSPSTYLLITTPLLLSRVILGLHYPIDLLGGAIFGFLIWFPISLLQFPLFLLDFIRPIFNFIFAL
ncbi:MAG: phosphatase PAP2 family protein [Candidatus Shapirobacteria bacterium]|nr:phosphatase PAP2 family protein [Candidatus Shapirobacteria bacterium]